MPATLRALFLHSATAAVATLLASAIAPAQGNTPPNAPRITEPPAPFMRFSPHDLHMETAPFSDPDLMLRDREPILAADAMPEPAAVESEEQEREEKEGKDRKPTSLELLKQSLGRP